MDDDLFMAENPETNPRDDAYLQGFYAEYSQRCADHDAQAYGESA